MEAFLTHLAVQGESRLPLKTGQERELFLYRGVFATELPWLRRNRVSQAHPPPTCGADVVRGREEAAGVHARTSALLGRLSMLGLRILEGWKLCVKISTSSATRSWCAMVRGPKIG